MMAFRNLWTCPSCKRQFANRNQAHSCDRYTVRGFLKGKSATAVALYEKFQALVEECGPVQIAPAKTRIGFQVRMIFAAVNRLSDRGLEAHVILRRRLENKRFLRIEEASPNSYVHHFRIETPEQLDDEVREWLLESYRVGAQES